MTSIRTEDVESLAVGDKITSHEEGAAWNQFVTVDSGEHREE